MAERTEDQGIATQTAVSPTSELRAQSSELRALAA
jgi:hypothetical protein